MPDVANFQEYTELKDHLASVGDTADPANVAEANAALRRYEQKYSLPSISDGPSLLAPDTGPRERGASYEPPARVGAKAASKVAQAVPQLSEGAERGITDPPLATPPASSLAQPPVRMIQKPGVGQLGATVQQMPSHVGGGTDILPDPPVSKFVSEVAPTLQGKMDALSFAAMMEDPEASPQFRQWLDEEWNSRSDLSLARGHSAKRIPAGLLDPSYVKDAPWEDRLEEGANRSLDALAGGSAAALNVGGLGAGTALAGAVGGENAAKSVQESERRHPVIGAAAGLKGASSPLSPGSLAARGINRGLLSVGARVAPKLTGIAPFIGRAAAAGVAGGVSNAAEGAGRDLIEGAATGDDSGTTVSAALQRGLMGSALGSAFHIAGEGFGALNKSTEKAYETELRDAGRVGAEPGLGGVKLAPGSPVQELENARVAQELPSGAGVAAGRVAPKIADEGAAIKTREIEQAKTETGQAYDRLARGVVGRDAPAPPEIADVPRLMPRPTPEETARHVELLKHDHTYVPPEQAEAVRAHAFGSDDVFKRLQRGEDTDAIAADIQQKTGRNTAGEHVAQAKAMLPDLERFMADTPPTPGIVYRGIVVDEATAQKLLGQTEFGMDGAITGSSRDPMVARSFIGRGLSGEPGATHGVTFKLKHSTGRGIEDLAEQGSGYGKTGVEKEVLLPGTARFKVTGRYEDPTQPNNYIIEAEEIGGRNTMPPGPGDAEANAFGRIAQEQGEGQASLLGVQQAVRRGAHSTPSPVTVSTAPVVEKVLDIIRRHNPADGELPFLPSDNVLREHLPKMAKMQYMPLDRAKSVLARSGKGWIQPAEDGPKLGLGTGGEGDVLLVIPRKMDAPSFDAVVQALDDRANFTGELKKGDPRFQELSAVAHETRSGFPGLNELKRKQTEGFTATDTTLKHAGVRVGQGGKAKGWTEGGADQQRSVENAVKQFKQQGDRLTDDALRTVAKLGGFESELNQIPGQIAVENLEKTMRTGENIPASDAGLVRRGYQVGRLHLYPHIKALGGTPAPEKELQAMAEALSPQLKRALRAMRVSPVAKPRVQDISGLTSRIGLKGGVMGQRVAAAAEESGLTEEDVTNLQRLKKAVGAN